MLITIIIALLFRNLRLMLCFIFSYDFPNIRNLAKIFHTSLENVGPVVPILPIRWYITDVPCCTSIVKVTAAGCVC